MNLNYNSISAKVYRLFYNTHRMPESLCPYFWKLVVAYPITILLLPLLLPTWIVTRISGDDTEDTPLGALAVMGAVIYLFIFLLICIGVFISSYWITYYVKTTMFSMYLTGMSSSIILGSFGVGFLIKYLIKRRRYSRKYNNEDVYPDNKNVVVEFVKAKYNKYCPKIHWDNN